MTKAKLTTAQQKVMEQAYKEIDRARKFEYIEWLRTEPEWRSNFEFCEKFPQYKEKFEQRFEEAIKKGMYKERYESDKRGEVLTICNGRTLHKLEELGLIEIVRDTSNTGFSVDVIRVLNY